MEYDLFTPRPSALIKWALSRPEASDLGDRTAHDPGVLVLARALGILGLYASKWSINWRTEQPFDAIPDLTDARIVEMHARTRGALFHRVDILERGMDDSETHVGRLLRDRANFSHLLSRPNSAPAGVRAALSAALVEDMFAVPASDMGKLGAIGWGPVGAYISNQIMVSMQDPYWSVDEAQPDTPPEVDCDACRDDAYTPWEKVWQYHSKGELVDHMRVYHSPLAQGKRYLESLKSRLGSNRYECPGWNYANSNNVLQCDKSFATHEALADHMLRSHLDDIGAELPARYLVVFAEAAAHKAMMPTPPSSSSSSSRSPTLRPVPSPPPRPLSGVWSSHPLCISNNNRSPPTRSSPGPGPGSGSPSSSRSNSSSSTRTATMATVSASATTAPPGHNNSSITGSTGSCADRDHAAAMRFWLPKMREWAANEERQNDSQQARRFQEFMERHPPSEELWNSLEEQLGSIRELL